jgi:protein-disulfide isomerase
MGLWAVAIMLFVLKATCPWCLAVHVANGAFFILAILSAWLHWKSSQRQRAQQELLALPTRLPAAAAIAAMLLCAWQLTMLLYFADDGRLRVVGVVGVVAYGRYAELRQLDRDPIELLALDDDDPIPTFKGRADAPDRLVILSCYTCPKCQEMNRWLKKIIDEHPDRLRVDFRMAPLSPLCNPLMTPKPETSKHRVACAAARAALAVASARPEAFSGFSDWLYLHRETMSVEQIMAEGRRRAGAGPFDRAIESKEVTARLQADVDLARLFDASSVPRLYIRAGQVHGIPSDTNLVRLLESQFGWTDTPDDRPGK